jgi:DNA-binding response OmpR family regulator
MRFLMLTGNANKEFVLTATRAGVDAYIAKPFTPPQLHRKIEALFQF